MVAVSLKKFFFFKQKTAYEILRSDWSSDVCSSDLDLIKTYTRVYVWYVITRTLFSDSNGRNAQWMWLKALIVFDSKWSWGTAALAYLYRQVMDW